MEKKHTPTKQSATDFSSQVMSHCAMASELAELGDYQGARQALGDVWRRIGERPDLDGLDDEASAEVLLRVGSLTGWIGSQQQIQEAQEIAKDLISESLTRFENLSLVNKVIEAQTDLALCYWREGSYDSARIHLREACGRLCEESSSAMRIRVVLNMAIVEASSARWTEALRLLVEALPLLEGVQRMALKGRFHAELALILRRLGTDEGRADYLDRALLEYAAASSYFEQAGDRRYMAAIENNLGNLYASLSRPDEAHRHLETARRLFVVLKSQVHVAQVDESRARVWLSQGLNSHAEKAARDAVQVLRQGDEGSLLAEAMTTHGRALARLGKETEAYAVFARAAAAAEHVGDFAGAGNAYLSTIEELSASLSYHELLSLYQKADDVLGHQLSPALFSRMRACMRMLIEAARNFSAAVPPDSTLEAEVLRFESALIRQALVDEQGSVTRAARRLGITHQCLGGKLKGRHRELSAVLKPRRIRRRHLMVAPAAKPLASQSTTET